MSARTPFSARCCRTVENSPWWRRALTPVSRRKRSKNGATVESRSIAISLPPPRARLAGATQTLREQRGVAAGAERAVDDRLARARVEIRDDLVGEDGYVVGL